MSTLMLASELTGRVVVTLGGEALATVKDTVFDAPAGRIAGFTLNGRGLLAGPMRQSLPFSRVHAIGPSAVMVRAGTAFAERDAVVAPGEAAHGDVLGVPVLTDQGVEVGTVLDLVIESGATGRVVGFEIANHTHPDRRQSKVFIPRGDMLAVSGEALVVPTSARRFVADDLPNFAAQVEAFRARARLGDLDAVSVDEGGRR